MYTQISFFEEDSYETFTHQSPEGSPNIPIYGKQDTYYQFKGNRNERRYKTLKTKIDNNPGVFGIYDKLGQTYGAVFVASNNDDAQRRFFNLLSSPDANVFSINCDDFILVRFSDKVEKVVSGSDFSPQLILKARHDRISNFADNAVKQEVKSDE